MFHNLCGGGRRLIVLVATLCLLLILTGGCGGDAEDTAHEHPATPPTTAPDAEPTEYTLVELSELARDSVVYVAAVRGGVAFAFGSGFVIDPDGIIVTNYHVLEGADSAFIKMDQERHDEVTVLAASAQWDLALIKVDAADMPALSFGEGIDTVRVGEDVAAVGNPEGLEKTVSDGIVSAVRFDEDMGILLIQTTAPISKGSSGGPLLNMRGEVIGVNTFTYIRGQNLNFAVPVDMVVSLLEDAGPQMTVASVFMEGYTGESAYQHQPGELAVTLSWDGPYDLDLEIWSEDFEFLGTASELGESPDIIHGDQGQEWFVFRQYPETDFSREYDLHRDFSTGDFVVSPYFFGPQTAETVLATLTVILPDGREHRVQQNLQYMPPYDQWFAAVVDVDSGSMQVLDLFADEESSAYEHQPGELAVTLSWDGPYDLDLEIWSEDFEFLGTASELGGSPDIMHGDQGQEWFVFRQYPETELSREYDLHRDFSTGRFIVSPFFYGPLTEDSVPATVVVILPDGRTEEISRKLHYEPPRDQWFAVLIDVDDVKVEVLDIFAD